MRKFGDREWPQAGHSEFYHVEISHGISLPGTAHLFYRNSLAIWSGFPDITHIKKVMANNQPFWPS